MKIFSNPASSRISLEETEKEIKFGIEANANGLHRRHFLFPSLKNYNTTTKVTCKFNEHLNIKHFCA
jgi:hypothetical protein